MKYTKLISGTDIRGVANKGVKDVHAELTDDMIKEPAYGFILWCKENLNKSLSDLNIAIGRNSRIKVQYFK